MGNKSSSATAASGGGHSAPIKPPRVQFYLRTLRQLDEDELKKAHAGVTALENEMRNRLALKQSPSENPSDGHRVVEDFCKRCHVLWEDMMKRLEEMDGWQVEDEEVKAKRKLAVKALQKLMDRLDLLKDHQANELKQKLAAAGQSCSC